MKIVSWNVNGLRAVYKNGFLKWFKRSDADIVCLQEIKAQEEQIPQNLKNIPPYYSYFNFAKRKGYSGVAVYTKEKPLAVENKLGMERFDDEGRILKLEYSNFTLINLYFPHGDRQKKNLDYKLDVYKKFLSYLERIKSKKVILIGDFNVAHQEIDLARPKQNQNNIMFTPVEREQISRLIKKGFIDTFRQFHKESGHHTWWPYGYNARERNIGWRIDYTFISKSLASNLKKAFILFNVKGSDHCPIGIEI